MTLTPTQRPTSMTNELNPGEVLTAETVGLLEAGDLLFHPDEDFGPVLFDGWKRSRSIGVHHATIPTRGLTTDFSEFTFIGRPNAEGWIDAPEGGWKTSPVPGCAVDMRWTDGSEFLDQDDPLMWGNVASFRLSASDEGRGALPAANRWRSPSLSRLERVKAHRSEFGSSLKVALHAVNQDFPAQPPSTPVDPVGAAEIEVGRAVYERIEKLIGAAAGSAAAKELEYLSHLAASVEEVGGYDGPAHPQEAASVHGDGEELRAEIERLKAENRDLRAVPWPRAYIMERRSEWKRLLREVGGYIRTCRGSCGSDMAGRDHAIAAIKEAQALLEATAPTKEPA